MPVPPMAPSPLAFAATLGGHVLVWKTAFLVRVSLPQEDVAQRDTTARLGFCCVSSSLWAVGQVRRAQLQSLPLAC